MPFLTLSNASDSMDLDTANSPTGGATALVQLSGLGLPGLITQWNEGAGDGSTFLSSRAQARDVDLPLFIAAPDGPGFQTVRVRLTRMLMGGPVTLAFNADDGSVWTLDDMRVVGGGDLTDRQVNSAATTLTLRAGDPCWTSQDATHHEVAPTLGRGLLGTGKRMVKMQLDPSQTLGDFTMENIGDAPAYPVWTIQGSASAFTITSATGEAFSWAGTLLDGQSIVVDSKTAAVTNATTGASRYTEMGPAPVFWRVPPGTTSAHVAVTGSDSSTRVQVDWRARMWAV